MRSQSFDSGAGDPVADRDTRDSRGGNEGGSSSRLVKASHFGQLLDVLRREASDAGLWDDEMHRDLPKRWEKHADMIVLPHDCFRNPKWRLMGRRLWQVVAESLKAGRVGRKRVVDDDVLHVDLLYGTDGWVIHNVNGVRFHYDVTKRTFNIEKMAEMQRIAAMECEQEVVVDMFAGIGYFTLVFLINAHAKHVYAVDWDEDALEALMRSVYGNEVSERCTLIQGDARRVAPQGVADRVNVALQPSSRAFWLAACRCLKSAGGTLHVHEAVRVPEEETRLRPLSSAKNQRRVHSIRSRSEDLCALAEEPIKKDLQKAADLNATSPKVSAEAFATDGDSSTVTHTSDHCSEGEKFTAEGEQGPAERRQRKMSRAASIIEEVEGRILPDVQIEANFERSTWMKLEPTVQTFAIECATRCTGYLNNIHDETGKVRVCTVIDVHVTRSGLQRNTHVVVDIRCTVEDNKDQSR